MAVLVGKANWWPNLEFGRKSGKQRGPEGADADIEADADADAELVPEAPAGGEHADADADDLVSVVSARRAPFDDQDAT
jgi:hypothetical protein